MSGWLIRVVGRQHKEIDKHLVVQAVLALGRQLKEEQVARRKEHRPATAPQEEASP
jgi:hypothetical protein